MNINRDDYLVFNDKELQVLLHKVASEDILGASIGDLFSGDIPLQFRPPEALAVRYDANDSLQSPTLRKCLFLVPQTSSPMRLPELSSAMELVPHVAPAPMYPPPPPSNFSGGYPGLALPGPTPSRPYRVNQEKPQISHSTVEKQRRDRINSLIDELRELVPPQKGSQAAPSTAGLNAKDAAAAAEARRPKHVVLADTIALLKQLHLHRINSLHNPCCETHVDTMPPKPTSTNFTSNPTHDPTPAAAPAAGPALGPDLIAPMALQGSLSLASPPAAPWPNGAGAGAAHMPPLSLQHSLLPGQPAFAQQAVGLAGMGLQGLGQGLGLGAQASLAGPASHSTAFLGSSPACLPECPPPCPRAAAPSTISTAPSPRAQGPPSNSGSISLDASLAKAADPAGLRPNTPGPGPCPFPRAASGSGAQGEAAGGGRRQGGRACSSGTGAGSWPGEEPPGPRPLLPLPMALDPSSHLDPSTCAAAGARGPWAVPPAPQPLSTCCLGGAGLPARQSGGVSGSSSEPAAWAGQQREVGDEVGAGGNVLGTSHGSGSHSNSNDSRGSLDSAKEDVRDTAPTSHTTYSGPELPVIPIKPTALAGVVVDRGPADSLYVQVKCRDRKGLLSDIINALKKLPLEVSNQGRLGAEPGLGRVRTAAVTTQPDGLVRDVFEIWLEDSSVQPEDVQNMVHEALFQQYAAGELGKRSRLQQL
ncbi:hypothetical protein QJQ45_014002 [Haematococcus lacustris]|nr:hypothetical protein QJQ45_014002 [Haematococcus lacustris]